MVREDFVRKRACRTWNISPRELSWGLPDRWRPGVSVVQQARWGLAELLTSRAPVLMVISVQLFKCPSSLGKSGPGLFLEDLPAVSAVLCFEESVLNHSRG